MPRHARNSFGRATVTPGTSGWRTRAREATARGRRVRWRVGLFAWLLAVLVAPAAAEADVEWAEWTYRWEKLTIVVRTNAGVYSPALQALGMNSQAGKEATRPANLMALARAYFVMTTASQVDHTFEFIEPLARQWGPGHALPILAAVALENVLRPIPTLSGGPVSAYTLSQAGQLLETMAAAIDPRRPGVLRITVHGESLGFRHAAERAVHTSANAYYDGGRNEAAYCSTCRASAASTACTTSC